MASVQSKDASEDQNNTATGAPLSPGPTATAAATRTHPQSRLLEIDRLPIVLSLVLVAVVFQVQSPYFLGSRNLSNLAVQITPLAVVALAEAIVLLMREIDLSLGSVAGLTAAIGATLFQQGQLPWPLVILVMLVSGAAIGALQGAIVVLGGVPAFIVTLGGYLAWLGIQLNVLGSGGGIDIVNAQVLDITSVHLTPWVLLTIVCAGYASWVAFSLRQYLRYGRRGTITGTRRPPVGDWVVVGVIVIGATFVFDGGGGVPLAFVLVVAVIAMAAAFLVRTPTGRHLYAIGGNIEAARRAGARVKTIRWAGFVVAGTLAALAGLIYMSYDAGASDAYRGRKRPPGSHRCRGCWWGKFVRRPRLGVGGPIWRSCARGYRERLGFTNHAPATKYVVEGVVVVLAVLLDSILRRRNQFQLRQVQILLRKLTHSATQ